MTSSVSEAAVNDEHARAILPAAWQHRLVRYGSGVDLYAYAVCALGVAVILHI